VDLPGGRFGFIVGDVAGKGSPAALLASAVTGMFGAESTYQTSPAAVISRINPGLFRRSIENRFLTTFYGVIGPDGALTYSNGGHNPPVLVTKSGVRRLDTGGMVLGLFEQTAFDEETVALAPGDFVIVFSDGVTEAGRGFGDDQEQCGPARWAACRRDCAGMTAQAVATRVERTVHGWLGRNEGDDLAVLTVRASAPNPDSPCDGLP